MKKAKKGNSQSYEKFVELLDAIDNKEKTKVYFLLKDGIDVNLTNENGRTPLMAAITTNDLDLVRVVVEAGADLEMKARDKETALLYACRATNNKDIVEYLIDKGADTKARNQYNDNALFISAEYNKNWQITEYLLDTGIYDIDDQGDIQKYTPLMAAARYNDDNTINLLLDKGAKLFAKDKSGWTPIFHAAANEHDDPTNLLMMLRWGPEFLFEKVKNKNIRDIAEEAKNPRIAGSLDAILNVFMFATEVNRKTN